MPCLLKLRTVLLCNYPYLIILLIVAIITIFRLQLPKESIYNKNSKVFAGVLEEYQVDGNKLTLIVSNKEKVIGNYYFKTLKEKNNFLKNIKLGVEIKCFGEFNVPDKNTVFNGFSYKDYLYKEDTFFIVSLSKYKIINRKENIYYKIKNSFYNRVKKLKSAPYIKTFLLGDKNDLKKDVKENYQFLGISHLFAISGMHITFLSGLLLSLLKKLKVREEKRYFIVMSFLSFYLILVGFNASILRAVIFFFLFSLNKIYYFYIKPLNIFILTLAISLLISPYFIYDVGFLYSFGISFALIYFSSLLNSFKYYLTKLFITSSLSFLISIPISLYSFYQINFMSIIYNMFYVPFVTIILFPLSLITYIFPVLDNILIIFIKILEKSTIFLKHINFGILIFPRFNIIYYIMLFIFIVLVIRFKNKILWTFLIFVLVFHYNYLNIFKSSFVTFIDVGQGDSSLFYSNGKAMLIDTGGIMSFNYEKWQKRKNNYSLVKTRTIPYLKSLGIKKLDVLVLTHGDYDHLGEALELIDNFSIDKIYINMGNMNNLEKKINKKHPVKKLKQGDSFNLGEFSIVSLNKNNSNENDSSLVLYIKCFATSVLMMGDATVKSEEVILDTFDIGKVDIIKLGHHGSKTSSSLKFLKEVTPSLAVISAGRDNKFNHPHEVVLKRLKKLSIPYLSTIDKNSINIDLKTLEISFSLD